MMFLCPSQVMVIITIQTRTFGHPALQCSPRLTKRLGHRVHSVVHESQNLYLFLSLTAVSNNSLTIFIIKILPHGFSRCLGAVQFRYRCLPYQHTLLTLDRKTYLQLLGSFGNSLHCDFRNLPFLCQIWIMFWKINYKIYFCFCS